MSFFLTDDQVEERLSDERNVLSAIADITDNRENTDDVDSTEGPCEGEGEDGDDESTRGPLPPLASQTHSPEPSLIDSKEDVFAKLKLAKIISGGAGNRKVGRKKSIRNRSLEENGSVGLSTKILGSRSTEKLFGVDPAQQNHIVHGHTGSVDRVKKKNPKADLLDEIYRQGGIVTNIAFERLLHSLNLLDNDKIGEITDPMKLLSTAKGLSGIVRDMTPKESEDREQSVHFHVYRPEQNQDSDYETIEVNKGDFESIDA